MDRTNESGDCDAPGPDDALVAAEARRQSGRETARSETGTPDFPAARQHVLTELVRFVADLREDGVEVPATGVLDGARGLATVGLDDSDRAAAALSATLLSAPSDRETFVERFPTFWHRLRTGIDRIATAENGPSASSDEDPKPGRDAVDNGPENDSQDTLADAEPPQLSGSEDGAVEVRIPTERRHASGDRAAADSEADARRYSAVGGSQLVDAARPALLPAERAAIDRFVDTLSSLPGRRRQRSPSGERIDARGALRASIQTGGAPLDLPQTNPALSELRCCLLVDVSGSVLDTLDRSALLAFAERLVATAVNARVFLFDTDVVEATTAFARADGDPGGALRDAAVEWGGGTRIGAALEQIRREEPYAVDRRTVVLVVSDGLDVGDPDRLADGITWLANRAAGVVWLNPLAVSSAFEPSSRGMSTVVPYLDALFGFAEAADLAAAARQMERHGLGGPVGSQYYAARTGERGVSR